MICIEGELKIFISILLTAGRCKECLFISQNNIYTLLDEFKVCQNISSLFLLLFVFLFFLIILGKDTKMNNPKW